MVPMGTPEENADRKWRWDSRTTFGVFQFFPHDKKELDNTRSSLLKNKLKKYDSCIRKQFVTEEADLWRGTPFKTCRLLIVKKKKKKETEQDYWLANRLFWDCQRAGVEQISLACSENGRCGSFWKRKLRFHSAWGRGDCLHRLISWLWRKGTLKAGFEKEFFLTSFFKSIWERKWRALKLGFGAIHMSIWLLQMHSSGDRPRAFASQVGSPWFSYSYTRVKAMVFLCFSSLHPEVQTDYSC